MKKFRRPYLLILLLLLALGLAACDGAEDEVEPTEPAVGEVEESPMPTEEMEPTEVMEPTEEMAPTAEMEPTMVPADSVTITPVLLATDLLGMDISSQEDDDVGEVDELLLDPDGTVRYVVFEVGGFLGIDEEYAAVEWSNMALQPEEDFEFLDPDTGEYDADDLTVTYAGSTAIEDLDTVDPGFFADEEFVVTGDQDPDDGIDMTPYEGLIEMSQFEDFNLLGAAGDDVGEIEDLFIGLDEGRILYTLADIGGFLGLGENPILVPWDALQYDRADGDTYFSLNVTEEALQDAPLFDTNTWRYPPLPDWNLDVDAFWEDVDVNVDVETTEESGEMAAGETVTMTSAILASDLIGMDISGQNDEELGEVEELLMDEDGTVRHVIFEIGGFLEIGEQYVSVDWPNMQLRPEEDAEILDVETSEYAAEDMTLTYVGTTPFDQLPLFDPELLDEDGYVLGPDPDPNDEFDAEPYEGLFEMSQFEDFNLFNMAGEDIGEVEDLVLDVEDGAIRYAVTDIGGFLGIAENSILVPWDRLQYNVADSDVFFEVDVSQTQLENAPLFDFDDWSYPVESDYDVDVEAHWDTE